MRALTCLFKVELRAVYDDRFLMRDVGVKYLCQRQHLRLTVKKRQHIHRAGVLKLSIFVELIENDLCVRVAAVAYDYAHPVSARLVAQLGDALNALFLDKVGYRLAKQALVHAVRDLRDHYAVLFFLDIRACAHHYAPLAGQIRLAYAVNAVYRRRSGEVGPLYILHKVCDRAFGVVHAVERSVNDLSEVVRRDVRRHTDGNADGAVHEQVGEACGKNGRFFEPVIEVAHHRNDVLVDVAHHLVRDL